jgi:hypothetical protein
VADPNQTQTKTQVIEQITQESQARGFIEYPKMLYHPDGRQLTVTGKKEEEAALRGDWCPTPQDALDVKEERDEADRQRLAEQIAADAKAKREREESVAALEAKRRADEQTERDTIAANAKALREAGVSDDTAKGGKSK